MTSQTLETFMTDPIEYFDAREQVQELLELIREFHTTCHMVAVGQLEPSKAKAKAHGVEERVHELMTRMIDQAEATRE